MPKPSWMLLVGGAGLAACSPTLADYCAPGTPECTPLEAGSPDGASDGPTEGGHDAAACDRASAPHDDGCVIAEAYGVFVAPAGSDSNPGTRTAPLLTLGQGMDVAKAAGKRVYVCAGTFPEKLVVSTARDGVNVYGALDCATWSYGPLNKVVVAPTETGYALDVEGLQAGITFEDVEFDAQPASYGSAGQSSIAVFANGSQNVAFERVTIVAGNAADGAPGASPGAAAGDGGSNTPGSNWFGTPPGYSELNGINAADAGGPPSAHCTCPDQSATSGGQGGGPMNIPTPGAGTPSYSDAGTGAPGVNAQQCNSQGSGGGYGGDAPVPAPDMPSASFGVCSATGWAPGIGVVGTDGKPGQGGGGGGNGRLSSGSGGGGACGGCGGAGGKPGVGGGSSIALLSYHSNVAFAGCVLMAKGAGNGGAGGGGEPGQAGGSPGSPSGSGVGVGCAGGAGGAGAGGNGAQGGPGGLSLGIGYIGAPPTIDGSAVTQVASRAGIVLGSAGMGGAGGIKGAAASSSTGPAGADGAPGQAGLAAAVEPLP